MPAHFHSLGICFQYPDNWTLDDSDALLGRKSVTVYSPQGAFWTVAIHSASADPKKLADTVVATLKKEYDSLEIEDVEEVVAGHVLAGHDLAFYCLDLTNTAQVRSFRFAHAAYTIYCQAEDIEYERIKLVFKAMTLSLLTGLESENEAED